MPILEWNPNPLERLLNGTDVQLMAYKEVHGSRCRRVDAGVSAAELIALFEVLGPLSGSMENAENLDVTVLYSVLHDVG